MNEMDNVPVQQDNMRPTILNTLKCISDLRNDHITTTMPAHRVEEWKELLTSLENLTTSCFQKKPRSATSKEPNIPVTRSRDCQLILHYQTKVVFLAVKCNKAPH